MTLLGRSKEKKVIKSRNWLDSEGKFLHGKYIGQSAEFVAVKGFRYILWILENVDNISEEDRKILETLLRYKARTEPEEG